MPDSDNVRLRLPSTIKARSRSSSSTPRAAGSNAPPTSSSREPDRMSHPPARRVVRWVALVALCAACAGPTANAPDATRVPAWTSRATPEARGEFQVLPDGKRMAVRYRGWSTRDFNFRTYAYDDRRPEPAVQTVTMPAGVTGNPRLGYVVFLSREGDVTRAAIRIDYRGRFRRARRLAWLLPRRSYLSPLIRPNFGNRRL